MYQQAGVDLLHNQKISSFPRRQESRETGLTSVLWPPAYAGVTAVVYGGDGVMQQV